MVTRFSAFKVEPDYSVPIKFIIPFACDEVWNGHMTQFSELRHEGTSAREFVRSVLFSSKKKKKKKIKEESFFLPLDVVISDVMTGTPAVILCLAWFGHKYT